jgi:colanic acid biosynthesis glycosyl transferase WcaI
LRFLLINQFYPPDLAPTGVYLHDLARGLVRRGHTVSVLSSRRGYDGGGPFKAHETIDGVDVRRLSGLAFGHSGGARLAGYSAFAGQVLPRLMAMRKPDVVVTMTSPPYVGLLGALLAERRKVRHVHWAMDIYPDVLEAHGMWGGFVRRKLEDLARWQMARTKLVIAPAPGMARRITDRVGPGTNVVSVPLWAHERAPDPADVLALRDTLGWPRHRLILLYSGNMGLGHRFPEFLECAKTLGPAGPLWLFAGSGPRRQEVEAAQSPVVPIQLLPYAGAEEHRLRSLAADVHLMSLRPSWDGLIVPSKLQAAFGLGRPVIFVGSREGEPGRWIEESGGGWVVIEDDMPGLIRAIAEATHRPETRRRGALALAYAAQHFDRDRNVAQMVELLERA